MMHTLLAAPPRALSVALLVTLGSALASVGCAGGSRAEPDRPRQAHPDDIASLEGAIARLEQRQLEQLQRQRELENIVAALAAELERAGGDGERRAAPRPTPARPEPSEVYAVPIDGSPTHGPDDAVVTIVQAFEFACPFCHRVRPTLEQLREEYGGDVRIVYKNFLVHPQQATTPALAACAAHKQGRHEAMETLIWERGYEANRDFSESNMKKLARDIGLDMSRFEADMKGDACRDALREDQALMSRVGARGTPTFFINGRPLIGAQPIEQFRAVIDEELAKANERVRDGTAPSDYYRVWVVEQGKSAL